MPIAPFLLWLRRLRVDRVPLLVLGLTVLLTAGLAAAAPMLAVRGAADALAAQLRRAGPAERSVVLTTGQLLQTSVASELLDEADRLAAAFDAQMPPPVSAVLEPASLTLETEAYDVAVQGVPPNPFRRSLILLARDGADTHIQLTEGRPPRSITIVPPLPVTSQLDPPNPATVRLELAISAATASAMGMQLGDRLDMVEAGRFGGITFPDQAEPLVIGEVVGIFTIPDPEEPFWAGERRLVAPNGGDASAAGAALVTADQLGTLLTAWPRIMTFTFAYQGDGARIAAGSPQRLSVAFNDLRADFAGFDVGTFLPVELRTGIPGLLAAYLAGERQAFLLLGLVGLGVAGIAVAALVLLGVLLADRRRAALLMQRERGAGAWQLLLPALAEAALVCLPTALAGWLAARLIVPADAGDLPLRLALGVAGVAVAACVVMVVPVAVRDLRTLLRRGVAPEHPTLRRLVAEGLVVALAVIGLVFIRSRGIAGSGEGGGGLNAYLAGVPLLAGLAAGLVVLRLYPYPVRGLARLSGRLRGLVTPLALRRAGRAPGAVHVPLVALLVAAALGAFGATVAASIERGQSLAAWRETGADYRVTSLTGGLPTTIDLGSIAGVDAVASAWTDPDVPLVTSSGSTDVMLVGIDPVDLAAVTRDTPADPSLPPGLDTPPADAGSPTAPIPALISANLGGFRRQVNVGERFELVIAAARYSFAGLESRAAFPGVPVGMRFVVVSRAVLAAALGLPELRAGTIYVRGAEGIVDALRAEVGGSGEVASVVSRAEVAASLRDAPLVTTVTSGFLISLVVAALYVTLTLIIGLLLVAAARARDVAYLRTMGLSAGQTLRMAILEQVPPILIAVLAGAALGLGITALIGGALDLGAFAGADIAADMTIDWPILGLAGAWLLAVAAIGVTAGALAARRVDPARALRIGE
ncbi:MAG: ABC transporter permease [Chloroflexota bacterium]